MHRAAAAWEDFVYNLARLLKLFRLLVTGHPRQRWLPCTRLWLLASLTMFGPFVKF